MNKTLLDKYLIEGSDDKACFLNTLYGILSFAESIEEENLEDYFRIIKQHEDKFDFSSIFNTYNMTYRKKDNTEWGLYGRIRIFNNDETVTRTLELCCYTEPAINILSTEGNLISMFTLEKEDGKTTNPIENNIANILHELHSINLTLNEINETINDKQNPYPYISIYNNGESR